MGMLMALLMFATSFIQPLGLSFGLLDVYSAEAGPSMDLSITYLSGGNVSEPLPGHQPSRQVMIGHGETNGARINMIGDFRSGVGEGRNAYFDLRLPYFYKDSTGNLATTYDFADIPADQKADPMCLAVKVVGDNEDWEVDKTTEYRGTVHFQSARTVRQGQQIALTLLIYFKGAVPENTSALIYLGGGYETYAYQGATSDGWSAAPEMASKNGIYEFICSNLRWEADIQAVNPRNALWDKFNYLVYKITVSNTSEDPASHITAFSANVEVPTEGNDGYGLHMKEAMHFLYNNGNPIEQTSFELEDREELYVGVPGQGGALIYDVTGIPQEVRDEWNLITFANAVDQNGDPLVPLPYTYTASSSVYFSLYENIYAQEYVDNDATGESVSSKEFYIALPMSTDIPDSQKEMINAHVYNTIVFGSDYTWTKQSGLATHGFDETKTGFTHKKYVLDEDAEKSEKTASIGDEVEYYLGYFQNTSNVPAFEANAVDTAPKDFALKRINAYMNYSDEDEDYDPQLEDWFKEEGTVEFEFSTDEVDEDGNAVTSFVPLGSMVYNADKSSDESKVFTLEVGTLIDDYIKSQALLNKNVKYTNKFRVNFKHRIAPNEAFDGKIGVQGVVDKGIKYENKLVTNYETWQWVNKSAVVDEADYYKEQNSTSVSTATIFATPADPKLVTDVTRVVDDKLTAADSMYVPINVSGTGFRYKLGNNSRSKVIPGILKSGTLLDINQSKPLGFVTNKIILSKALMDIAEVDSVTIYCFKGKNAATKAVKIPFSDFSVDEDGNYYIESSAWKSVGECYEGYVNFKSFGANIALSDDIYVQFAGYTNVVKPAADPLVVTGTFTTDYKDSALDKAVTDPATMIVNTINPIITGFSFDDTDTKKSNENTASGQSKQTTINHIEIPNKQKNVGYEWSICNDAISPSGAVDISIDLSSSVGNKTPNGKNPTVKGFLTQKITISDFSKVADVDSVKIYDWNKNPATDEPNVTIPFSSLTVTDGKVVIGEDVLKDIGYVKNIVLSCSEFYGSEKDEPDKMNIRLDGYSDWYGDLDAALTFTPENTSMANRIITLTNRLRVLKPYAEIHAFIDYYDLSGSALNSTVNSDKNEYTLGVPYDRNFHYSVKVGNPYVSKLDDFEITLDIPLSAEGSDYTGFHTTGMLMSKNLIDSYKVLEYFTFYDASDPDTAYKFDFDKENGTFTAEDGTIYNVVDADGNISIDEKTIFADWGIENLGKVVVTGKDFAANVDCEDQNYFDFSGFADSTFGTSKRLGVTAVDYFDCIRTANDAKTVSTDGATAYISKMYFDSTIVAAYKDSKTAGRFDAVSSSNEHIRMERYTTSYTAYWEDNSELDIGYKAMGSFLVDFRQYLNANTNTNTNNPGNPQYPNTTKAGLIWQEHQGMNYVYTRSFNTAANVDLNITLPDGSFDASYLKVHPMAKDYLESIKITRKDGTETIIDKSEWENNSVETAVDTAGNSLDKFFRIDLLQSAESEDLGIYKTPVDYKAENPVTSVVISLNINKTEAVDNKASNPDYGTWFDYFNDNSRYMFEVAGRFYKAGPATATVKTDMEIGNIVERPYAQAKDRSTQGVLNQKTDWSFKNQYRYYWNNYGWYHADAYYDAADLFSTAKTYVYNEQNQILKGVHNYPTTTQDLNCTFGMYNEFSVSFFQNTFGSANDYANGGAGSRWVYQDRFDWDKKHGFTDRLVLEDKLPLIKPDAETDYYGYLTQKIYISPQLYPFIDYIEFTKKTVTVKDDGTSTETIDKDKIILKSDDLKLFVNDGTTVTDPTIVGTDEGVTHEGFYEINVYYPEDKAEAADNSIILGENEFLDGYAVHLKNLPGNGDYTKELDGLDLMKPSEHNNNTTPDIFVGGEVYRVRETNPPATDYNKMTSTSYHYIWNAEKSEYATSQYYTMNDTGLLMGYRIPFQAAWKLISTNTKGRAIYDYHEENDNRQNVEPNIGSFDVKIWNRMDTDQQTGRSAYIDTATVTNTMNNIYRLKHIYIPEAFIDGDWFNVESLKIIYGSSSSHTATFNLKQLKDSGYLTKDEANHQYIFDLNPFIKDHIDEFAKFNPNNYENGDVYVSEWIHSFVIKLSAVNAKQSDGAGVLKGGEFLNPERQKQTANRGGIENSALPTFSYDGVYADRTVEDITANTWTKKSRPTIWHGPNGNHEYSSSTDYYNYADTVFTSSEKNAETYKNLNGSNQNDGYGNGDRRDYYNIKNLVANMNVKAQRVTTMEDGSETFAYDIDYSEGSNTYLKVDKNHLLPDDYIEYQLTVAASADSMLPVYHPDIRFVAPTGQRVVGWYIIENTSDIPDDDITGKLSTASTGSNTAITASPIDKKAYYSLVEGTDGNEETYYRRLDISAGDLSKEESLNQLAKGKKIVVSVITQLTDELSTFEGKTINPGIYAAAHPQHTYSQYKIRNISNDAPHYTYQHYYDDSAESAEYWRYTTTSYYGELNNELTYMSDIRTSTTFYDSRNLKLDVNYTDSEFHYDGMPMKFTMTGGTGTNNATAANAENDTLHSLERAVYTVSFLQTANGKLFKGFDLTEKKAFPYPDSVTKHKDENAKVEYCYFVDASGDVIGTDEGIYETNAPDTQIWISEDKVIAADSLTEEQIANGFMLLKDAVRIRWTYSDIPAGTAANPIVFATPANPFELIGVGRYRDIRTDAQKKTTAPDDYFTFKMDGHVELKHKHDESIDNTLAGSSDSSAMQFTEPVSLYGTGVITKSIVRERPILNLHTQIFKNEAEAEAVYNSNAAQVKGYRPGDTVWFKDTVQNLQKGPDAPQGVLLNPVFFDKIPEYISASGLESAVQTGNTDNIRVVWYNRDGTVKTDIPEFTVTKTQFEDVPDYLGDTVTTKSDTDGTNFNTHRAFADITLGENGNTVSTPITFNLYQIKFKDGTRLEIGEHIEVYYSATVRMENLPLSYTQRGTGDNAKTFVDYYPKYGEYYSVSSGADTYHTTIYQWLTRSYPYIGVMSGQNLYGNAGLTTNYCGSLTQFMNANSMMDMNYLYHDLGVSGLRNKNIDKYEYLKDSNVYMPGYEGDEINDGWINNTYRYQLINYGGSNGYLKDYDVNIDKNQQKTTYVPTLTANMLDQLPASEKYVGPTSGRDRDWFNKMLVYRNRSANWQEKHEDAVIWAESRIHLQTAWLAAGSQIIGSADKSESTEYLPTNYNGLKLDPAFNYNHPTWASGSTAVYGYNTGSNTAVRLYNDDNVTAIEYDQYFTSRVSAYNYGDWDLTSGIEFTYVMPKGIEPEFNEDGSVNVDKIKAYIMSSGTSNAPKYESISDDLVSVQVLQKPGSAAGYKTPNIMQDPVLSSETMNKTGHSYVDENQYYSADDATSWVLRITVNQSLNKWFNRGSAYGYMMYVDIPSHVYETPESEYWYDEVMVKPVDTSHQDSLYYQIYDTTSLWGHNDLTKLAAGSRLSTQYGGMDYLWNSFYHYYGGSGSGATQGPNGNCYYVSASPNMPYINGMNISNREVSAQDVLDDSGKENFESGVRNTYASTGTRAHMRKPLIRTWTTVGQDNISGTDTHGYYLDSQGDTSTLNIHVENKYWLNTMAVDQHYYGYVRTGTYSGYYTESSEYNRIKHTYSTDGGNKGTLYYPVVTNILPVGIVPKDINGRLFTTNNDENAKMQLDWSLYNYSYSGNSSTDYEKFDLEKELYEAKVEYILLDCEDGSTEGRYKVTFKQKSDDLTTANADKLKISSEDARVFQFKIYTLAAPSGMTKDNKLNNDLLDVFQRNHTFVSSQLENFRFLIDSEVQNNQAENPYYVGSRYVESYRNWYAPPNRPNDATIRDVRKDSARITNRSGGVSGSLPDCPVLTQNLGTNAAIDGTDEGGNKRYFEEDGKITLRDNFDKSKITDLQMEDYTDLRHGLTIQSEYVDFDAGNDSTNIGVHTTNRIRVRWPDIESNAYLTDKPAKDVENLGVRSPEGTEGKYVYYPDASDKSQALQYGDTLYYNVKVSNGATADDHFHHGNVLHAKIKVVLALPDIVRFVGNYDEDGNSIDDAMYLIHQTEDGTVNRYTFAELEDAGYEIKFEEKIDANGRQLLILEVLTPGDFTDEETPNYIDYVAGKHLPGWFSYNDKMVVSFKTTIHNNMEDDSDILSGEDFWDNEYKADSYVALEDIDGEYLKQKYPGEGFESLSDCDESKIGYERETAENKENGIDIDYDDDLEERFSHDVSAVITLLKPHAIVRLDTSEQRIPIINPDLTGGSVRVVEDPAVKGATKMTLYIDRAINDGAKVPEFILDYRVPFRGTYESTRDEADASEDSVKGNVYAVGTGVWEIPETAGDEEYREALKKHLSVKVYGLYSDSDDSSEHGKLPYEDNSVYENVNDYGKGKWVDLTSVHNSLSGNAGQSGVPIDENTVLDITSISNALIGNSTMVNRLYQLRFVISSDDPAYLVPQNFRLAIDADPDTDGVQNMDDIDPDHENLNPLPESITSDIKFLESGELDVDNCQMGDAAFVIAAMSHQNATRRHVNHFVNAWARYDDEQYGAIANRSRAGYFITREMPVLEVDLKAKYFKRAKNDETGKYEYSWSDDVMISDSSKMLKYTASMKNLSDDSIADTNLGDVEQDAATDVQISTVLPFIQNIDKTVSDDDPNEYKFYQQVSYNSEEWQNTIAPDNVSSTQLYAEDSKWCWHVENEEGEWVSVPEITSVTLRMYDKITDLTNTLQRRVLTFTSAGILRPGQRLVIDFMVPVTTDNGVGSSNLLSCKAYGFKPGAYIPFIPSTDNGTETYAFEIDKRDVNNNNMMNSENTITKNLGGISFSSTRVFNRTKVSFSEYGTGLNVSGNDSLRPSVVPEGTKYSFISSLINPDTSPDDGGNRGYDQPIIYDVLPYKDDISLIKIDDQGNVAQRGTNWRGYIRLDSIYVKSEKAGIGNEELKDGVNANIWIGPFNYDARGNIVDIPMENLPNVDLTSDKEFFKSIRGEGLSQVNEKKKYFVRLRDILALKDKDPERYDEIERHVQAIYVEPLEDYYLGGSTKLSLSYDMKAPLNIPLYTGLVDEADPDLKIKVQNFDSWNSFAAQTGDEVVTESAYAGVYLATPSDKGYIGHYVWLDENYNADFTDEGDYINQGGRLILDKPSKDVDYDGEIDDPGINNVKVELLSENGYPVNRFGEPVVDINGKYYLIDEATGEFAYDTTGNPTFTTAGPVSYTTEKDVYGHNGYFIISNITPGNYKLRYIFPENGKYDEYALTTRFLGVTDTPVEVYRKGETLPDLGNKGAGDEPSDCGKVNTFVVQTKDSIRIDAIGKDTSKYEEYDAKMTTYDLGVAPSFKYGGFAFMDNGERVDGQGGTDGYINDNEERIPGVSVQFYEVKTDENGEETFGPAYNADGEEIKAIVTDENGHYGTTLYPYRSYIAIADTSELIRLIEPSPITRSTYPLRYENDNDLTYNKSAKANTTAVMSVVPQRSEYPMGECVNGQYGIYNRLNLGFVDVGIGSIGKYVFHDENYDGVRNESIDEDGLIITEPGVNGVTLVLEQYYLDSNNNWVYVDDIDTQESYGSAYTFIVKDTTYIVDGERYLCGYKVKMDMSTVPEGFVPTKYQINNGNSDSDLPLTGTAGSDYRYLNDNPIIIAALADEDTIDEYKMEAFGQIYNVTRSQTVLDVDAGLTIDEKAEISGLVWNDKNYDGCQNSYIDENDVELDETGVSDIELQLVPYVYANNKWSLLNAEDLTDPAAYDAYIQKVITDENGDYKFENVESTVVIKQGNSSAHCIVGYKIKVNTDIENMNLGATKYLANGGKEDSRLIRYNDGGKYLNPKDEYIITAKKIADSDVDKEYGKDDAYNQNTLLIHNALGYFDINKVVNYDSFDAGLTEFESNSVSGRVWIDKNYNGLMDDDEIGIENITITLKRYYLEKGGTGSDDAASWIEDADYNNEIHNAVSDENGDYSFDNLATYVYKNGKYYLAGYKPFVAAHPDNSFYAATLYRVSSEDGLRNNDLKNYSLTASAEYLIVADMCDNKDEDISTEAANISNDAVRLNDLYYVVKYRDKFYDIITSKAVEEIDAGYHEYDEAKISGRVFDDINYDGYINTDEETGKEDGFTEELKEAIRNSRFDEIIVTATGYYYDSSDKSWKQYRPNGEDSEATYTASVSAESEDGRFEITVPTKYTVNGQNYMAGFKLKVNMIPLDYHITKHMANGEDTTQNALLKVSSSEYLLTKTNPNREYSGELKEELEGYVIVANPSDNASSPNIIRGYDIADSRDVSNYNIGYTIRQKADIDGIAFIDNNDNGIYDWKNEDGTTYDSGKPDEPLQGVEVGIKRYIWDEKTDKWALSPNEDDPDAEYYATTVTGEDGRYTFAELLTHEPSGSYKDIPLLYGYKIELLNMPVDDNGEELAATYYQKNNELLDSALIASTNQVIKSKDNKSYANGEHKNGYIIIANKIDDSSAAEFSDIVDGYDTTHGVNRDGYNLGFADYETGSIEGSVFEDKDYNGIIDETDSSFKDIELGIKRYSYVNGSWKPDPADDEYYSTVTTSANGHYSFRNLPLYKEVDNVKYLYGYEVYVVDAPEGFALTRYQQNNGDNDSALLLNGQIIKSDSSLYEMLKGKLVLGNKITDPDQTIVDKKYIVDGYDIVRSVHLEEYNAGYKAEEKGTIAGTVFDDKNYDGAFDESDGVLSDVEVSLKRFVFTDGKWIEDEEYEGYSVLTDENGKYSFDDLDTYISIDGTNHLYGYEVWVTNAPDDYAITRYQNDSYVRLGGQIIKPDSELSEMLDGKIVVAGTAEDTAGIDPSYIVEGYNTVLSASVEEYNAGYIKEQKGTITGVVFDDKNYDGVLDEDEELMSDVGITLKRFICKDGKWEEDTFFETITDENGQYSFEELDTYASGEDANYLYGYEVWVTEAPDNYAITRYQNNSYVLLNGQIIKPDTELSEMLDGKIVVAAPAADKSGVDASFIISNYNIVLAETVSEYDAGYKALEKGTITGRVFSDSNYDGAIDEDEAMLADVEVTLKRFIYVNDEWLEDEFFEAPSEVTDKNGNYTFKNLDTYVADEDANYLYGYEVWVTGAPEGYAITRYQNDSYVLLNGQIIKPDTELSEMLDGKIVVAAPAADKSGVDASFIIENYNVVLAEAITEYNAGYKAIEKGSIKGLVFNDSNYNGAIDEDESMLADVEVTLKRFVFINGKWEEDTEFDVKSVTDKNGNYTFNNLDTYVTDEDNDYLYGYEVWVTGAPDGYAITRYQNDSYVLLNGQIIKPNTELSEMLGGKIVVAAPAADKSGVDASFIIENYNVVLAEAISDYNAGYKAIEKGSISGKVFDDKNYDGNLDDEDELMSDIEITLKRFAFINGKWEEDTEFDVKTVTDKNGAYSFENLDTYVAAEEADYLYGYEVWVTGAPEGYAVTKYINDSSLLVSGQIIKANSELPEMLGGKIVVAEPAADKSGVDPSFIIHNYNVVLADDISDYNGGYKLQEFASISGNVFDDMNYDGVIDEEDMMLSDIQIGLKRFVYENGEWISAQNEDEEFYQTAATDENGGYRFTDLETYVSEDGVNKLYGYELYVIIENRFATKYQMNGGENDSALVAETNQIIKKDANLPEMLAGKIVLANPVSDEEIRNTPYIIENYDIVQKSDLIQYNAGLVPVREYSISGYVWNDADRDGIAGEDEQFMSGVNVTLERLYLKDGKWYELPQEEEKPEDTTDTDNEIAARNEDADEMNDEENPNIIATDKNGYYSFGNLPLYTEVDGNKVVCGYKVKIEELPNLYAVTEYQTNHSSDAEEAGDADEAEENGLFDNDLNDKTGYLEENEALIILADDADEATQPSYNVDDFNISYGESVEHLDAGLVPFGAGSIAGVVFEDANENGVYDDGELIFEGEEVYLDYFVAPEEDENENGNSVAAEGSFENYRNMKAQTDGNGYFIFENLPVLDENNQPYQYKLHMGKPDERSFTKVFAFEIMGEDKLNILSQDNEEDEKLGSTPVITLAVPRADKNFYDIKWQLDGYNHTNAYLGLSGIEDGEKVYTGTENINPWLIAVPASAFGLLILVFIVAKNRKRKETD